MLQRLIRILGLSTNKM